MSLAGALSIATSGLGVVQGQIAVVSQNVAGANSPGYVQETASATTIAAGGADDGVRLQPATRLVDAQLQTELSAQNATVSATTTSSNALAAIGDALGTVGSSDSLPGELGTLTSDLTALQADPSSTAQQQQVVLDAGSLAGTINGLAATYTQQRQAAQDDIATSVTEANTALSTVGQLSNQIVSLKAQGQSTAALEDQRDAALGTLSNLLGTTATYLPNGDVSVTTASGLALDTRAGSGPLATSDATIAAGSAYPGSIPAITLGGIDVTGQLVGGSVGADIALRDTTLPGFQAQLDSFAGALAGRFDAQGLRLFSDASGNLPAGNATGFAAVVQVNPAVQSDNALVRDGTADVAGSPAGASAFTTNPAGGDASFSTLLDRVVTYALGDQVQEGVAQPAAATSGLGASGTIALPYGGSASLAGLASSLTANQANTVEAASNAVGTETAVQTQLQSAVSSVSGVSLDTQMSDMVALQNAYGANAKIISTIQGLFTDVLDMVGS